LFEVIETTQHFFIFMEYVPSGDLVTFIESKGKVPEDEAKGIFRQVMEAIQFVHSNSIVHRDIKAENFLVTVPEDVVGELPEGAPRPTGPRLKLTDFGLADWASDSKSFSTPCGSPSYTGMYHWVVSAHSDENSFCVCRFFDLRRVGGGGLRECFLI
jgi:serine/threonine protein kinase